MKHIPDDLLAELAADLSRIDREAMELWSKALRNGVRVKSPLYRRICTHGKKAQRRYMTFLSEAERRGWTGEQLRQVFTKEVACGYG